MEERIRHFIVCLCCVFNTKGTAASVLVLFTLGGNVRAASCNCSTRAEHECYSLIFREELYAVSVLRIKLSINAHQFLVWLHLQTCRPAASPVRKIKILIFRAGWLLANKKRSPIFLPFFFNATMLRNTILCIPHWKRNLNFLRGAQHRL